MKTIAFNKSRGMIFATALTLGGLAAVYFYRRNRGASTSLLKSAAAGIETIKGFLRPQIAGAAKSVRNQASPSFPASQQKMRQPQDVDLDHMPAI